MRPMVVMAVAATAALVTAANASDAYKIKVTRTDQDLYEIVGQGESMWIKTAYCYQYATWGEAILILNSQPYSGSMAIGKLVFTSGGGSCQVDTILK